MAIVGKALSRGPEVGGRPCLEKKRRVEIAFGLLSIAIARRRARSGLMWNVRRAEATLNWNGRGWARNSSRAGNGDDTTVNSDFG
jgi:hypothetical protein